LCPRLHSGREYSRDLRVIIEPAYEELLAFFVGELSSVALGLVKVGKRFPPQTPVLTILK